MKEPWRRVPATAGSPSVLNTRSLATGHRRLAELQRPGISVLDVGCGPGAITRGIAQAVTPEGRAVGADLNEHLVEEARRTHAGIPGLTFEVCDVYNLVAETPQLEVARRGDPDFHIRAGIWAETAAFHGPRMVEDNVLTEQQRAAAEADYRHWVVTLAQSQTLYLVSVDGFRPL